MKIILTLVLTIYFSLMGAYTIGDTVDPADNISWTDNYGYSSDIFTETFFGKPVVIFFGQDG
ncbi:MAG: hypothetical protein GQ534_00135 [Candidatus Delongbacteria bacterium]|nr:hypothetical protein [Candidatus Delongbacteria bacterium]